MSVVAETVQFLDPPGSQRPEQEQDAGFDTEPATVGEDGTDREPAGVGAGSEDAELVF